MSDTVLMRVKAGKRPLPYNDGTGPKEHQPGEIFEGPAKFLLEFKGHVEAVDKDGNVIDQPKLAMDDATADQFNRLRPHERVTLLQEFKAKRQEAHTRELQTIDAQIAEQEEAAKRDVAERQKRREHAHADEKVEDRPAASRKPVERSNG